MSEVSSKIEAKKQYTVCIDFDGVRHSYTAPWVNAHTHPDPPVIYIDKQVYHFDNTNKPTLDSKKPLKQANVDFRAIVEKIANCKSLVLDDVGDSTQKTLNIPFVFVEPVFESIHSLLYAAEIALNRLRELPDGHDYEINLLIDAIRNAGGLPEGRDSDGVPV